MCHAGIYRFRLNVISAGSVGINCHRADLAPWRLPVPPLTR